MKTAEKITMTVAEARRLLFDSNKYAVIGSDEFTNDEARRFLFEMRNQDAQVNIMDMGDHLCIWGIC